MQGVNDWAPPTTILAFDVLCEEDPAPIICRICRTPVEHSGLPMIFADFADGSSTGLICEACSPSLVPDKVQELLEFTLRGCLTKVDDLLIQAGEQSMLSPTAREGAEFLALAAGVSVETAARWESTERVERVRSRIEEARAAAVGFLIPR